MKKQILLLVTGIFLSVTSIFAQQPTNGSFETWPSADVVANWGTYTAVLAGAGVAGQGLETKNTNATYITAGTASIKLTSKYIAAIQDSLPGGTGYGYWSFSGGTINQYGVPFTARPDSISFSLAYAPVGGDSAIFQAYLTKNTATVGGVALFFKSAVPTMTKVTVPFQYSNGNTPDTIYILFSTAYQSYHTGSTLYVDDVKLIYNTPALPTVSIAAIPASAGEASGTARFVATLSAASASAVTASASFTGTAANPADYTLSKTSFSFAAGKTTDTIKVTIVDDALVEGPETIIATLGSPVGATIGVPAAATLTIVDNDVAPPTVSIAALPVSGIESANTARFVATLSAASASQVTVTTVVTGTASNPADYTLNKTSFTFAAGKTADTITATIVDDATVESSETIIVTLGVPVGATLGSPASATYTIVDNDGTPVVPTVSIAASVSSIGEAGVSYKLVGTLSQGTSVATAVSVNFTGTATNTVDFSYNKSAFGFAAGKVTDTITVTIVDDALVESSETIIATLGTPSNCTIGSPSSATTTIVDNDAAALPTVSVVASQSTIVENGGTLKLIATLSAASASTVTVGTTVTGTATTVADYGLSKTTFSFAAGKTKDTITVTIVDDALSEATESIITTLSSPSGATIGSPASATISITDNDNNPNLPNASFVAVSSSVNENVGTVKIIATLSSSPAVAATVALTLTGTATNVTDYSLSKPGFTFAIGKTTDTITITIVNDVLVETNETIIIGLNTPVGCNIGSPSTGTITIIDNDANGIEQTDFIKSISLYPNPARESFKVELPSDAANHTVSIIDVTGKTVKQIEVTAGNNTISTDGLVTGNYTLMFVNASEQKLAGTKQLQIIK